MIGGQETNAVYLSGLLENRRTLVQRWKDCGACRQCGIWSRRGERPDRGTVSSQTLVETVVDEVLDEVEALREVLAKHGVDVRPLGNTRDIWCRDYMPIQVSENRFVRFQYDPWYLKHCQFLRTDPTDVGCELLGGEKAVVDDADIVLDGGNVVACRDKVVVTDRVFEENHLRSQESRKSLIRRLEGLFGAQVLVIPALDKSLDMTGHADGMVRWVDENTLVCNGGEDEALGLEEELRNQAGGEGIKVESLDAPYPEEDDDGSTATGCYVNFLEVGHLVVVPTFGLPDERKVVERLKKLLPGRTVETVAVPTLAEMGGALNCITWTVKV